MTIPPPANTSSTPSSPPQPKRTLICTLLFPVLLWATMQLGADATFQPFMLKRSLHMHYSPVLFHIYLIAPLLLAIPWLFARRKFPILSLLAFYLLSVATFALVHHLESADLTTLTISRPLSDFERQTLETQLPFRFQELRQNNGTTLTIQNNPTHLAQLKQHLTTLHLTTP